MSRYSIKDLEHLSGIKAHTIRVWEQRYGIINPKRTSTNIRYYDSGDLKLILNIARLKDHGFKISKIAAMSHHEILSSVLDLTDSHPKDFENHIHNLTTSMIDLDEALFENSLSTSILQMGFESTMVHVIYPFLVKIGFLWQAEAIHPAQEHFITCLIRQKIITAIDGQKLVSGPGIRRFMLFLPEQELHEINLLFAHFILKKYGNQVVYLGQSLPMNDIILAYNLHKPHYLLASLTSAPKKRFVQSYIDTLAEQFPKTKILLGGSIVTNDTYKLPSNVSVLSTIDHLYNYCQNPEAVGSPAIA
ncbi:MAG: MerR family transcriptional regulator [Cyclobacteriaceae bacterium]|nr:MerR family transcriptional regulator [Cyclobacteriaceae bacterium]